IAFCSSNRNTSPRRFSTGRSTGRTGREGQEIVVTPTVWVHFDCECIQKHHDPRFRKLFFFAHRFAGKPCVARLRLGDFLGIWRCSAPAESRRFAGQPARTMDVDDRVELAHRGQEKNLVWKLERWGALAKDI